MGHEISQHPTTSLGKSFSRGPLSPPCIRKKLRPHSLHDTPYDSSFPRRPSFLFRHVPHFCSELETVERKSKERPASFHGPFHAVSLSRMIVSYTHAQYTNHNTRIHTSCLLRRESLPTKNTHALRVTFFSFYGDQCILRSTIRDSASYNGGKENKV